MSKPTMELTVEDYDSVVDTNMKAAFVLAQEVGKRMIERGEGGRIINISSMLSYIELRGSITYCMSKAAVNMMTKVMAQEMARHRIKVNAVCPGYIATEMNDYIWESEIGQRMINSWPNRRVGTETDINGLILYLVSDASDFMTGSIIPIDDGQTLGLKGT
jgi:NAD(P)-dependent dehydrogenase (short-subunit alcohol dehydrogenase family)